MMFARVAPRGSPREGRPMKRLADVPNVGCSILRCDAFYRSGSPYSPTLRQQEDIRNFFTPCLHNSEMRYKLAPCRSCASQTGTRPHSIRT